MTETGQRTRSQDVATALVDAAERVLVREGLPAVTVRAVAAEAGVAPMGVYNRFGTKGGLVAALLVRGFDGLTAALGDLPGADPTGRLEASGRAYRAFALGHPQHYAAMFGPALSAGDRTEAQEVELAEHAGAAFGALEREVARAMAAGRLRRADLTETAQAIWSAVHGAVSLELAGVQRTPDPEASYEALLQLLLTGLGPARG
ncbi:TetR/AcrR family transcriptional regulator [Klenkia sp. PcliD-1-E]|uniref:TetR/AcrR family transcriptional regulator n=1 Tax=Klenkia sp. PcliD-1-E TaxID=2954492 RepID=UPI002097B766|nr:TetR/AcrR family transcriptional regulator [Klenkia sp. PcliD-1-E]MCO7221234.1 TetR/AcrR family transcriptional regulator [Klenkia sp. PcliD-1-E]